MFKIILWAFILVMIFRFITRFVFPILNITRVAQDKIRQMQEQMNEMQQTPKEGPRKEKKTIEGDYIDYEEVK